MSAHRTTTLDHSGVTGAMSQGPDTHHAGLFVETVDADLDAGETDSYVFLHGLGGTHRYWTAADGARSLPPGSDMVDLLGFGDSPRPLTRYTLDKHLAALETVLADRPPFVLVGHSLGAAIALQYAARHPDNVERLILISLPAYGDKKSAMRWLRQTPRGWFFTNMLLSIIVCVGLRRLLGPALPLIVRDVPRVVAKDLVEHNFMSSTTSLWNVLYRRDVGIDADALPGGFPITFIHGTLDTTAPITPIQRLVRHDSEWRLIELVDVDHHPWLRDPVACAEAITSTPHHGRMTPYL